MKKIGSIGFLLILSILFIQNVQANLQKIASCKNCNMDLFDNRFDSKFILNQKETVFCSIECLVKYVQKEKIEQAQFFVSNYEQPNKFLDAQKASFLISKKITSPMGAHLAAFSNAETAKKMAGKRTGNVYSWSELHDVLLTK